MFTPPSNQAAAGSAVGAPVAPVVPASTQFTNPFLDPSNQTAYQMAAGVPPQNAMTNGAVHSVASSKPLPVAQLDISTQQTADDLECFIPGCGKPVHVDAKGVKSSDYCSMRHRECVTLSCCLLDLATTFSQGGCYIGFSIPMYHVPGFASKQDRLFLFPGL